MIDNYLRRMLEDPLDRCARILDRSRITPDRITALGLVLGLGSALSAGLQLWLLALALWIFSRLADGLDGPLARRRIRRGKPISGAGGFFDITADFTVYGTTVVGVAVGASSGYDAPWWPFLLVLLAYYINGTAFLAFSSIAEKTDRKIDDGRSLSFLGGLAEGAETIAVHSLWLLLPQFGWQIAVVWAGVVTVSSGQRIIAGYRALS
ncbi:CDP-alcohol phosphatidyltransferase family protein [Rhodococcus sp. IEGM 1318]|uniref:CDP-alcohol phosphatidyltransferase family protein n=1 Tax=Rhodococcus sp. IEGM 1318 TaxID=3082226 RepID=UPI0029534064|nr:CDP-alcohol phosphatidyltransferase family protein [Rhodococcus sp. IEGM 1318]MDV8009176.1 CDP-alcohol phosphatidyltransferase family protein [Rhodococcus sp. IEGM 1318]